MAAVVLLVVNLIVMVGVVGDVFALVYEMLMRGNEGPMTRFFGTIFSALLAFTLCMMPTLLFNLYVGKRQFKAYQDLEKKKRASNLFLSRGVNA